DISGHRVVYTSNQSGNPDIWMFEFTEAGGGEGEGEGAGGGEGEGAGEGEGEGEGACEPPSDDLCADETGFSTTYTETFARAHGKPTTETRAFAGAPGPAVLVVHNNGCSSAVVNLNGDDVVVPSD